MDERAAILEQIYRRGDSLRRRRRAVFGSVTVTVIVAVLAGATLAGALTRRPQNVITITPSDTTVEKRHPTTKDTRPHEPSSTVPTTTNTTTTTLGPRPTTSMTLPASAPKTVTTPARSTNIGTQPDP